MVLLTWPLTIGLKTYQMEVEPGVRERRVLQYIEKIKYSIQGDNFVVDIHSIDESIQIASNDTRVWRWTN